MVHSTSNANLIIYQPGYGGNLLCCLFSLDPITKSLLSINYPNIDRSELYTFNHSKKFANWESWHAITCNERHRSILPNRIDDRILTLVIHPKEYLVGNYTDMGLNFTIYLAALSRSEFSDYWLMRTKEKWNGFPFLRRQEIVQEEYINNTYNPITISVDSFLNLHTWQDEYLRINKLMNLTPNLTVASKLYRDWYDLRVAPLRKEFDILSTVQINIYSEQRDNMEANSRNLFEMEFPIQSASVLTAEDNWVNLYNQTRGVDWPDCPPSSDFYKLPIQIQQELIVDFNYNPL